MRVRFIGFAHTSMYHRSGSEPWWAGDVREVGGAEAQYLLETFPGAFKAEPEPVAPAPEAPEVDRAIKSPKRGRAAKEG